MGGDLRAGLQLRGHWGDRQPWGVTLCLVLFNDMSAGLLGAFSGIL